MDPAFFRWFDRLWFRFMQPTDAEWAIDWYRDPGAAWWEA